MLYTGPAFSVTALGDGIVELKFDLAGESVNKLSQAAIRDFAAATRAIAADASVKAVVVTSGKGVFIVGADITEFGAMFADGRGGHRQGRARGEPDPVELRGPAGADRGRDQRRVPRRRARTRARRRLPRDVHHGVGRVPGSEAGHLPGFRRLGAHAARDRHRQRRRMDLRGRRQEGGRSAEGWRRRCRRAARAAARSGARDGTAVHRRQARLAGSPRRQAGAGQAQQDRADDGVQLVDGRGRRAGRPELPGADAGAEEHAGSRHARSRCRARGRGEVLRQGSGDAAGQRADRRVRRRPGRQEGGWQLGEEEQARDQAGGRARRRHHGRRHRLPGGATRARRS